MRHCQVSPEIWSLMVQNYQKILNIKSVWDLLHYVKLTG